jgi:hypothetical protein
MADRDPTLGELGVMLSGIKDTLSLVSRTMVTTDVFNMWRDGNDERVKRVEEALEKWTEVSTKAHVELAASISALEKDFRREMKDIRDQQNTDRVENQAKQDQHERALQAARNGRVNVWLAGAVTVIATLVINVAGRVFGG